MKVRAALFLTGTMCLTMLAACTGQKSQIEPAAAASGDYRPHCQFCWSPDYLTIPEGGEGYSVLYGGRRSRLDNYCEGVTVEYLGKEYGGRLYEIVSSIDRARRLTGSQDCGISAYKKRGQSTFLSIFIYYY